MTCLTLAILLACRTADLITGTNPAHPTLVAADAQKTLAHTPTRPRVRPTWTRAPHLPPQIIPTEAPPPTEPPPTEPAPPTDEPPTRVPPTNRAAPTRVLLPTHTPTPAGPTATPAPTRCPQQYCVVYRGCETDAGNTIVEGVVYNNGEPENGIAVRVAKEPGAYPEVDDFISGTEIINRGKPDPKNPGHYFLQIVAGAPREGNWWVFIVDVPNGTKQLSEAKLIHTNDDPYNPGNCQHAYVDFVR